MEFDVVSLMSEVNIRNVADVVGDGDHVVVLAFDPRDLVPVIVRVELVWRRAGRAGEHRLLMCPRCGRAARVLRCVRSGLACGRCRRRRTAQQNEYTTAWWNRLGGRETDLLARLLLKRGRAVDTVLSRSRQLAARIVTDDLDKGERLARTTEALLAAGAN